jgi:GNAT superfamily N-acetyltransferase
MQRTEIEPPGVGDAAHAGGPTSKPRRRLPPPAEVEGTPAMSLGEPIGAHLRDGSPVTIRRSTTDDEPALREFLSKLCLEARRLRFFTGAVDLDEAAHLSAEGGPDRIGLVAFDQHGTLVGHALCIRLGTREAGRAEVAVEVADDLHGLGLGTILVERLAEIAEGHGLVTFVAEVLPDNDAMLDVFRDGFDADVRWRKGVERVEFPTSAWRLAQERYAV